MSHYSICISLTSALSRCWGSEQVRLLSAEEIAERTEVSQLPLSWVAGSTGIMLKYAYATQRGYYPNEMKKLNQDAFKIVPSFGEDPRRFLMGVFDGHGDCGELAARFVRDNIETTLISLCARYRSDLATALRMTFMQINQRLIHQQEHYMALSGTTACTCFARRCTSQTWVIPALCLGSATRKEWLSPCRSPLTRPRIVPTSARGYVRQEASSCHTTSSRATPQCTTIGTSR